MAYSKGKIRGITIEIGGDTTQFQKAMSKVDDALKGTQSKLKDIDKLLKLDPKNTELLTQKQETLQKVVENTKQRLAVLNDELAKAQMSNAPKEQVDALNREIIETEHRLQDAEKEAINFGSVFSQQLKAVGNEMKEVGGKISDTGKDLSLKLTAPIVALGTVGINYNAQMEQYRTMFTTLTGSAEEADRVISQLQEDAQKSPFDSASLIQANQYLISAGVSADDARTDILNLGNAIAATGGGSDELNRMAQNLQQIKNVGKATSVDIKQFANAGINIYGLLAEATGKTVEEVKEMDVTYEELSNAFALASAEGGKYYGAMEAQGNTLNGSLSATKESIQMLLGSITESAMPIIVQLLQKVKEVIDTLMNMDDEQKQTILTIAAIVAAVGPALVIIGKVVSGVGGIISAVGTLHGWFIGTMMPWLTGTLMPWLTGTLIPFFTSTLVPILTNPVTLAIGAVIAAGVLLWKNWDTVKEKGAELLASIKDKFNSIKQTVADKINAARDAVKSAIDKIKGFFKFSWSLPKLKLPHISISGSFSLKPPSAPHFSIDWYSKAMKNGMILNNPTIFGMMDGKLLGGGESGSETIVGTNSLMSMIAKASKGTTINMTINAQDQNVYQLADIVIDRLVQQTNRGRMVFK